MTQTLKILSLMLSYPSYELKKEVGELRKTLNMDETLAANSKAAVEGLFKEMETTNLLDLQENFVHLFDRTRALSLNLFEHVHGESRDRGQAMVNLMSEYEKRGLNIDSNELPDYLPVFLEFVSTLPDTEAQDYLSQVLPIITALEVRLAKRKSAYKGVFQALISLVDIQPDEEQLSELLAVEVDDPDDKEAIDKLWEETEVAFGPSNDPNAGCPAVRETLAHMTEAQNATTTTPVKEDAHG